MSHSKRNTSLAFFTSHERSLLRSTWGTRSTRLGRDAFLPFGSCLLCLQPSRSPCACPRCGGVFCRECAVQNLLAQRKEIQRLEKEEGRKRGEAEMVEREKEVEERERAVRDFEAGRGAVGGVSGGGDGGDGEEGGRKRKRGEGFELDEGEMRRGVLEERKRVRREIDEEKAAKPTLPSFWVPSLTPSTHITPSKPQKLHPLCPASSPHDTHPLSLKSLITLSFSTTNPKAATSPSTETHTPICPACDKVLTNTLKAVMTVPCGHVLCKPCAGKFMAMPTGGMDPHAEGKEEGVRCFVCEADLTGKNVNKKGGKKGKENGEREGTPGLVEIRSEGTGFAGGGTNMATREGVAFQC